MTRCAALGACIRSTMAPSRWTSAHSPVHFSESEKGDVGHLLRRQFQASRSIEGQNRLCRQRPSTAGLPSTAEEPQPWPSRPESDRPQIVPERNTTSCNVLISGPRRKEIVVQPHFPLDFPGTGSIAVHVDGALLGCHPPGSARRACGGASIAMGDADPEDEDDGQQATPQANKERRKSRYR